VEHWKLNTGLTQSGGFASAWAGRVAGMSLAQATGAGQPATQVDGSLLFDGVDDSMMVTMALTQPCTVYLLAYILSGIDKYVFNTETSGTAVSMYQSASEVIGIYAGGAGDLTAAYTFNTFQVFRAVFNGASSALQVDAGAVFTGDVGTDGIVTFFNIGGIYDGFSSNSSCNIQVKEILIYGAAHDTTQGDAVRAYLATV
jgi:hypothetical protein